MTTGITGWNTTIAQAFRNLDLPAPTVRVDWKRGPEYEMFSRLLICHGALSKESRSPCYSNMESVIHLCELELTTNPKIRICVIGSESGISGSFDKDYAAAKAGVHNYVETRRVGPNQQLVCIAPTIIGDSGMTERRDDKDNLNEKRQAHPKGRFLTAREVALMAYHLLHVDEGYTTNCVIRMNGGAHTA